MKAYSDFGGFADPRDAVVTRDRRSSFATVRSEMKEAHNARGLVIALLMSAACWGAIGAAFLIA